jgi:hypothetical protein
LVRLLHVCLNLPYFLLFRFVLLQFCSFFKFKLVFVFLCFYRNNFYLIFLIDQNMFVQLILKIWNLIFNGWIIGCNCVVTTRGKVVEWSSSTAAATPRHIKGVVDGNWEIHKFWFLYGQIFVWKLKITNFIEILMDAKKMIAL